MATEYPTLSEVSTTQSSTYGFRDAVREGGGRTVSTRGPGCLGHSDFYISQGSCTLEILTIWSPNQDLHNDNTK